MLRFRVRVWNVCERITCRKITVPLLNTQPWNGDFVPTRGYAVNVCLGLAWHWWWRRVQHLQCSICLLLLIQQCFPDFLLSSLNWAVGVRRFKRLRMTSHQLFISSCHPDQSQQHSFEISSKVNTLRDTDSPGNRRINSTGALNVVMPNMSAYRRLLGLVFSFIYFFTA